VSPLRMLAGRRNSCPMVALAAALTVNSRMSGDFVSLPSMAFSCVSFENQTSDLTSTPFSEVWLFCRRGAVGSDQGRFRYRESPLIVPMIFPGRRRVRHDRRCIRRLQGHECHTSPILGAAA
jgi:hypothetical protein